MKWPQWNASRADVLAVLFALVLIGIVAVVLTRPTDMQQRANAGFGADWECTPQAKGGPTCIRKPGR
jgi:hypothetical protein